MADPISAIAIAGLVSSVAGAGVGAMGAATTGSAQAAQYNYQAGVAQMNAQVAEQDRQYALAAGEVTAQETGMRGRAQTGATRAAFGASNVMGASHENVLKSETAITQYEEALDRANAAKTAYGYAVEEAGGKSSVGALGMAARTSKTAGEFAVASSIIGGAGNVSSKWLQGQSVGLWGGSSTGAGVNPDSAYGRAVYSSSIYS
jgi:hypothetical protein